MRMDAEQIIPAMKALIVQGFFGDFRGLNRSIQGAATIG